MSLDVDDPRLAQPLARLHPYARGLLREAGDHALRLHADAVAPEHVLSMLMEDTRCAAHAAVLHAFADPATISEEALAISPGLMVVASGSTLPFSARAAAALASARTGAELAGEIEVDVARILAQATARLDAELLAGVQAAGFSLKLPAPTEDPLSLGTSLFKHFSASSKRVLSAANRLAASDRARSISHVHLFLGCLQEDGDLATRSGLGFRRARLVCSGRTEDTTPVPARALPADPSLLGFLEGLPAGADSLALLARIHLAGSPELAQILQRSKVSPALLDRARNAFRDPEEGPGDEPPRRSGTGEL
jgi:hypothetical protein